METSGSFGTADWEPASAPTVGRGDNSPTRKELAVAVAIRVSAPVSGTDKTLSFETGKYAFQADGAVVARVGDDGTHLAGAVAGPVLGEIGPGLVGQVPVARLRSPV